MAFLLPSPSKLYDLGEGRILSLVKKEKKNHDKNLNKFNITSLEHINLRKSYHLNYFSPTNKAQNKMSHTYFIKITEHLLCNKPIKFSLFGICHFLTYNEDAAL